VAEPTTVPAPGAAPEESTVDEKEARPLTPVPWVAVGGVAVAVVGVLIAVAGRYGYFRDELYFRSAGLHLDWGYADAPPLVASLARVQLELFGDTVVALRIIPALLTGALVVIGALTVRELGGGRLAQFVGAAVPAVVLQLLISGHRLGTPIVDVTLQALLFLLLARALRTGRPKAWIALGVVAGFGLLAKYLLLLVLPCVILALLVAGPRRVLATRWPWLAAAIAVVISLPGVVWEITHGFPQLETRMSASDSQAGLARLDTAREVLLPNQLSLLGWWLSPLLVIGLAGLLLRREWRHVRATGLAYVLYLVLLFILGGKAYYAAGFWVILLSAGVVLAIDRLPSALPKAPVVLRRAIPAVVLLLVAANGFHSATNGLPFVPERELNTRPVLTAAEQVGWPELADAVASAYKDIPADRRASTVIVTQSAQQAGALDRYGPERGLPQVYSGHLSFHYWGPPPATATTAILVGFPQGHEVYDYFDVCRRKLAWISNRYNIRNNENGRAAVTCESPVEPWSALWQKLRQFRDNLR
jgi:hypothetical protein